MTETSWTLPTKDGHTIYGVLNTDAKHKNDKVIVIVHGLTGNTHEHHLCSAAQYFPKYGYDVIRFNLYGWGDNARKLHETKLTIHADDTNTVIRHFKKNYKKIFACGHSYGGPTLMLTDKKDITALSLWDPTYLPENLWTSGRCPMKPINGGVLLDWGIFYFIGNGMIDEAKNFDRKWAEKISAQCKTPLQTIYAEKGMWIHDKDGYHTNAKSVTEVKIVKGTEHCFNEEGTTKPLLKATRMWFDKF